MCACSKEAWQSCSLQYAYLQGYQLSEYETMVFVPCLIEKAGHNQVCSCTLFACTQLLVVPLRLLALCWAVPLAVSMRMLACLCPEHALHGDRVEQFANNIS